MKVTKTIVISNSEILEYFISLSEDCTIQDAKDIIKKAQIEYDIKESGDYDRGTYKRELKEITIEF